MEREVVRAREDVVAVEEYPWSRGAPGHELVVAVEQAVVVGAEGGRETGHGYESSSRPGTPDPERLRGSVGRDEGTI